MDRARYTLGIGDEYDEPEDDTPLELDENEASPVSQAKAELQLSTITDHNDTTSSDNRQPEQIIVPASTFSTYPSSAPSKSYATSSKSQNSNQDPSHDSIVLTPHQDGDGDEQQPEELDLDDPSSIGIDPSTGTISPRAAAVIGSLVRNRSLFSIRGMNFAVASVLVGLALMNFMGYSIGSSHSGCAVLGGFILSVGLAAGLAVAAQIVIIFKINQDSAWTESSTARTVAYIGGAIFFYLLAYTFAVFALLSQGACLSDTISRQLAMIDGIIVLSMAGLAAIYAVLRWKLPNFHIGEAKLWSNRVKMAIVLLALAMSVANLASVIVNGEGRTVYHRAIEWTQCPETIIDCSQSIPMSSASAVCLDQDGDPVSEFYCASLPHLPLPSPSEYKCPLSCPSASEDVFIWVWELPQCKKECSTEEEAAPYEAKVSFMCKNLRTRELVADAVCKGVENYAKNILPISCQPNLCVSCQKLYRYDMTYAVLFLVILIIVSTDAFIGESPILLKQRQGHNPVPSSAAAAEEAEGGGMRSQVGAGNNSLLSILLTRSPRISLIAGGCLLGGLAIYTLVAATEFVNEQCRNFLAVSVANAMITINATLFSIVFLVRHRQQVWSAPNPFESMGLL